MKLLAFPLAAALAVAFAPKAHAQLGVKAGINAAEIAGSDGQSSSYKTFYHVGVFYQIKIIGPLSIQPEVQYSLQGGNLKDAYSDYDTKLHYFALPVLAKLSFGPVFVEAGPQFGALVNATQNGKVRVTSTNGNPSTGQADNQSVTDQYKRADFSLAAGAGLRFSSFSLGVRYVAGLNDINDAKNLTGLNDAKLQNRVFQAYAAIQFGK